MRKSRLFILFAVASIFFSSCVKDDYYSPQPTPQPPPVGYRYTFNDNFDYDSHNWSFSDPANQAYVDVNRGTLNYSYTPANDGTNTVAIQTGADLRYDFLIQTSMRSDYAMGLAFGVSNSDYGYSFFIDDQGYFAVYREGTAGTGPTTILDWQQSSAIRAGWNDIEFEQVGNYWSGYANGTKLFQIPAQALYGTKMGFITLAGTTGQADYLTVQW